MVALYGERSVVATKNNDIMTSFILTVATINLIDVMMSLFLVAMMDRSPYFLDHSP